MKSGSTSHRNPGLNFLASLPVGGLMLHGSVGLANNCTGTDCTSTEAAIWPRQSKASEDVSMPIPGWHPFPETSCRVATLPPDGSGPTIDDAPTDKKGDFQGDMERTREKTNRLSAAQPHVVQTAPTLNGVHEIRTHLDPWAGSLDEAQIASSTLLQNQG